MTFKRKIYEKLLDWKKNSNGERAILVEGARRIGKSTIVEEFAKNEYKSYILVDFNNVSQRVLDSFDSGMNNLDDFFMNLSVQYNVKLERRNSLIIFDEIQRFPKARQSIKYLVKDGRYDYIETGSLISIKENVKNITIPSEERKIRMFPMDFEEFAWAFGEELLIEYIKKCFREKIPLEKNLHEKAMLLFKQYILVGGMPQSVVAYLENDRDFEKSDEAKRDILNLYRNDIMKISDKYKTKVISIFDQIPSFLSGHEKRVLLSTIVQGSTIDQYDQTFFWLADSMIANECFNCSDPNFGLSVNEQRTFVKCYLCDTGLLVSHSFSENEIMTNEIYKQILNDKLSLNEGMLFENAVSQMLCANGHKFYFYTHYSEEKHRNDIEIDFIISNNSKLNQKLFPIEVKSTEKYKYESLKKFNEKYKTRISQSYVIHPKNFSEKEDGIIAIPAYMTICL